MVKMTTNCEIKSYFEAMQITTTTPCIAPRGGGTQQSSIQGGSARR